MWYGGKAERDGWFWVSEEMAVWGNSGGKWRDGGIAEENDIVGVRGSMWKGIGEMWG